MVLYLISTILKLSYFMDDLGVFPYFRTPRNHGVKSNTYISATSFSAESPPPSRTPRRPYRAKGSSRARDEVGDQSQTQHLREQQHGSLPLETILRGVIPRMQPGAAAPGARWGFHKMEVPH